MSIDIAYRERRQELDRLKTENDLLKRQIEEAEEQMLAIAKQLKIGQEALLFLERVANSRRGAMKGKIEDVVSEALRLLYGPDYSIEMSYSMKNNRSHLEIELVRDADVGEVRRSHGGFGEGCADTISVPMRLMVLIGSRQTDRICVLDECWKHVDAERVELVGQFIRVLADRLGIQVVLSSHHTILQDKADKAYHVTEHGGTSNVSPSR
jgi:chromosome segregation ATPase